MGPAIGRRTLTKYSSHELKCHCQMSTVTGVQTGVQIGLEMGILLNSENVVLVRDLLFI